MNIASKSFFVISLCLFCVFSGPLNAEESEKKLFSFSVETTLGFFYGQSEEIVYKDANGTYLSELLWDMKPLLYYGTALSVKVQIPSWSFGFYTDLSVNLGIAGRSGIFEDRDWMDTTYDYLTHYSRHDNYTKDAWFFNGDLGISIPLYFTGLRNPTLSIFGRFSYMELKWISQDGYTQYGDNSHFSPPYIPWEDSFPKISISGPGIQYSQFWIVISPGIAANFPLSGFFTLDCSFTITPLIWAAAEDLHLFTKTEFRDYPQGGLALEPEIQALFFLNRRCSLSLQVSWRYISGAIGDSWTKALTGSTYEKTGIAGAGLHVLNTGISFKVYF
ncbi:MAG: omptin family outer membrane protease [Spirochaetaceae bacterium]|jgi:outer membrane protease|nr:omptin family outer membrane protease [Spirochaetaceae bacterium]